jgi:hypothetical protein
MATAKSVGSIGSQALQQDKKTIYLRQTDPALDLPLSAAFGGLDNRRYQTGDFLIFTGTAFTPVSIQNAVDVLVVDRSRTNCVKWSSTLTNILSKIQNYNLQATVLQNTINTLSDESLSIGSALNGITSDKQQLQNKMTSLNLYVAGQEGEITDINNSLIGLQGNINDSVITIDNLQSGLNAITIRVGKVSTGYNNNVTQVNVLSNIISQSQTSLQNQQLTSTGTINSIINGDFNVWQRSTTYGPGANTSPYITADRWYHATDHGGQLTSAATLVPLPDGTTVNALEVTVTNNTRDFYVAYLIEDVTSLLSTQTLSVWLRSPAATTLTFSVTQNFGPGGSAPVTVITQPVTFSTITRFTCTFTLPSTAGLTITAGSFIALRFSGPTWTAVDFARVQLQKGNSVFSFEERQYQSELRLCQRYYEAGYDVFGGYLDANQTSYCHHDYKVNKRVPPTVTVLTADANPSQTQFTLVAGIGPINTINTGSTSRVKNNRSGYGTYTNRYFADAELYL